MASTDEERLVVLLEARIRDFEKNMAKASGTATRSYDRMRRGSQSATRQMETDMVRSSNRVNQALATTAAKVGSFGKAFATGFVASIAGLGIAGIISQFQDIAHSVAEIGDAAKIAGVDVKSFQELKYVAEQNRIGVDALTDGIKEMNLRADEFILSNGKSGSASQAFQRLGFDAVTLREKLKKPSELFTEIIGKLGKFDKAAQIRIADEVFGGTGGEKFVQLIDQGEQGIRDTIKAANDLGIVMDDQLIARAAEVDRRFNEIANTVGSTLKSAIVSAADSLAEFIDGFRAFQNQMTSTLESKQAEIGQKRLSLENRILEAQSNTALNDRARAKAVGQYKLELDALTKQDAEITNVLNNRVTAMQRSGNNTWTPPPGNRFAPTSGSSSGTARERKAVQDYIAQLEEEIRMVNASDQAKRASEAVRKAGAAATDEERRKIIALNETLYQEQQAHQHLQEQMDFYKDLSKGVLDDIRSAFDDGQITWEEWGQIAINVLNKVIDKIENEFLDAVFNANGGKSSGGGFLGSLFSSLFGGGSQASMASAGLISGLFADGAGFSAGGVKAFAKGGTFSNSVVGAPTLFKFASGTGLMGEAGPEAIMPLSRDSSGRLGVNVNGGNSGQNVQINIINNAGASVTQKERKTPNGQSIDVMIDAAVAKNISTPGSNSNRALRGQFGLNQGLARR